MKEWEVGEAGTEVVRIEFWRLHIPRESRILESLEAAWLSGKTLGSSPGFLLPGCVTVSEMLYLSGPSFPDSPNEGLH